MLKTQKSTHTRNFRDIQASNHISAQALAEWKATKGGLNEHNNNMLESKQNPCASRTIFFQTNNRRSAQSVSHSSKEHRARSPEELRPTLSTSKRAVRRSGIYRRYVIRFFSCLGRRVMMEVCGTDFPMLNQTPS